MNFRLPIILIGPMAAGKSSVAWELAKRTNVPNVPMDRVRWYYYFKAGYSIEKADALESFSERMLYWKPFELIAVKQVLADFPESIIDFGAGHSHYSDPHQFEVVQNILNPIPNIFLILPSEDKEESIRICNERMRVRDGEHAKDDEVNRLFIEHPSNYRLGKHIIYNDQETPEDTAQQIAALLV